jgi:hypothetical protein
MLDDDSPKTSNWENLRIAHYLELSLAETPKNENLLMQPAIFGQMEQMPSFLAMVQCLPLWPMYI